MTHGIDADSNSVAGLLLPTGDADLLLPNAAVAEIIAYRPPMAVKGGPAWLMGEVDWRERLVPVVSVAAAQEGGTKTAPGNRARLAICFTPSGNPALAYVAVFASAPPRLARFHAQTLEPSDVGSHNPFVLHSLRYNDAPAWIPDMDAVERSVLEAIRP